MKIGDFEYIDSGDKLFDIRYDSTKRILPKSFYKYYSLSKYSVDAIINSYIYATHPNQLNDPFDCDEDIICVDKKRCLLPLFGDLMYNDAYNMCKDAMPNFLSNALNAVLYRKYGIFSMTIDPFNELMWSLYSQSDGFCVELDITKFMFKYFGAFPVNYVDNLPQIHIPQHSMEMAMCVQSNVKRSAWSYENEWRLIIPNPEGEDMKSYGNMPYSMNFGYEHNRHFHYPIEAIKRIILGPSFIENNTVIGHYGNEILIDLSTIEGGKEATETKAKLKTALLDYITDKNVPISILLKDELSGYNSFEVCIRKEEERKYRITEL